MSKKVAKLKVKKVVREYNIRGSEGPMDYIVWDVLRGKEVIKTFFRPEHAERFTAEANRFADSIKATFTAGVEG